MSINYYKATEKGFDEVDSKEAATWISVMEPDEQERQRLVNDLGLVPEHVVSALDEEERSHTDYDDEADHLLMVMDCPFSQEISIGKETFPNYDTDPFSIFLLRDRGQILTVSLHEPLPCAPLLTRPVNRVSGDLLCLALEMVALVAQEYQSALHKIERRFKESERALRASMSNKHLERMLEIERSLVYLSTSLNSLKITLARMSKDHDIQLTEEREEFLEDAMIEIQQADEMCQISIRVLNSTTDTFGDIINNNLSAQMRRLTLITLILSIPTMVFSFYGMNTSALPLSWSWLPPLVISLVVMAIAAVVMFSRSWPNRKRRH